MTETPHRTTALIVVAHHREGSLTHAVAERAARRLAAADVAVDVLDLHREGFDPRNTVVDEPDYDNRDKRYSEEVHAHFERLRPADLVVPVFPVWWFGPPAVLKGWFDRVWNYGLAYGRSVSPMHAKRMLWIGLAGLPETDANADLIRALLDGTLRRGIAEYCGVTDVHTLALWDSEGDELTGEARDRHYEAFFAKADAAVGRRLAHRGAGTPEPQAGATVPVPGP